MLKVDFEQLNSIGSQVSQKAETFQELLDKINQTNSNLNSAWEGTDATKYTNAVAVQAEQMQKLATAISEIGLFIAEVSAAYQKAMEENASAING